MLCNESFKEHPCSREDLMKRNHTVVLRSFLAACLVFPLFFACSHQPAYPAASQVGPNIVIDPASLTPEIPQFYTYHYQGKNISYFVLKVQGKVLSFFDACASCYPHKRGYRYENGSVTCRNCNVKFSIFNLEKGLGSCYPLKIEGRMENGKYLIPVAMLKKAENKF